MTEAERKAFKDGKRVWLRYNMSRYWDRWCADDDDDDTAGWKSSNRCTDIEKSEEGRQVAQELVGMMRRWEGLESRA